MPKNIMVDGCELEGIIFITTEESYTSGTSLLDDESPIKSNYNKTRRIKRGLFKPDSGKLSLKRKLALWNW